METVDNFIFQIDSELVTDVYRHQPNYLVEYDERNPKELCAIYFSSNNIYYPNTEKIFTDAILKKNRFEWYGLRVPGAHKHIFVRDIQKQWYLTGINARVDNPGALADLLAGETRGYTVITVGSSAGGFAAVLFGQLLQAIRTYCFNPQYEVVSLLSSSSEQKDPVLFRNRDNPVLRPYYDIKNFITHPERIYYFYSNKSAWDISQYEHIKDLSINVVSFNTSTHGPPVLKCCMSTLLSLSEKDLKPFTRKPNNPFIFSYRLVGLMTTVRGAYDQLMARIKKR
jgi:hypothetical protein